MKSYLLSIVALTLACPLATADEATFELIPQSWTGRGVSADADQQVH